jgi:hypothetical protein
VLFRLILVLTARVAIAPSALSLTFPFEPVDTRDDVREGGVWTTTTIDGNAPGTDVGGYTYPAFDPNESPHITSYDWADSDLEYACNDGSGWKLENVDSAGDVGNKTRMILDSAGLGHAVLLRRDQLRARVRTSDRRRSSVDHALQHHDGQSRDRRLRR